MKPALGSTLKAYRQRRGLSQSELAAAVGWDTAPARISRYEQDRVLPNRDTLDGLSAALDLTSAERGRLFLEAGYVPTDEEVAAVLQRLQPFLEGWKGPAYIVDFTWRFLGWNQLIVMLFAIPPDEQERMAREKPTLLDLTFDPRWAPRRHLPEDVLIPFARGQIARFKAQHRERADQRWYRQLVQRLLSIPLFRDLWYTTSADLGGDLRDYNRIQIDTPGGRLDFHMFASPLLTDPRLVTILWLPADDATAQGLAQIPAHSA